MLEPRKRLSELPELQCAVLGTCLSMGELRRLARKLALPEAEGADDFTLHVRFVSLTKTPGLTDRLVTSFLNKKYARAVAAFRRAASPDEMRALWRKARADGDIPGPFWALVTHGAAPIELVNEVFGEVHMLSHLVGSANRADLKALSRLSKAVEAQKRGLTALREILRAKDAELEAAKRRNDGLEQERRELCARLEELSGTSLAERARQATRRMEDAERQTREHQLVSQELRREVAAQVETIESLYRENARLKQRLIAMVDADVTLRASLAQKPQAASPVPGEGCAFHDSCENCPCDPSTCKTLLYVGGIKRMTPHYKRLAEEAGYRFEHHDGGLEEGSQALSGKLSRADMVVCPVSCISHEGCACVKKACERLGKPVVFARSASASALSLCLGRLEAETRRSM